MDVQPPKRWNARQGFVAVLAFIGLGLCVWAYPHSLGINPRYWGRKQFAVDDDTFIQQILLFIAAMIALIRPLNAIAGKVLDRLRSPSPALRRWTVLGVAVVSGMGVYLLGAVRNRVMLPVWHDESMYRMQTTFLAHGRFCMPGLPLPDFFESPYIFVHGVYGPIYFIGTALLHVPAAWLHLPYSLTPVLIASASSALLYLIVTELIDGVAGLLAVILMISLVTFRWLALVEMSHASGMMWGLVTLWAWLRWRERRGIGWAVLGGLAAGWYAITRPLDAACVVLPVAVAWAWDLREVGWKKAGRVVVIMAVAAAPLLGLQLAFDRAMTGNIFEPPLDRYNRTYFNARSLGLQHFDPNFRPASPVPQIQWLYDSLDAARYESLHDGGAGGEKFL